jgi:hypothetical protein
MIPAYNIFPNKIVTVLFHQNENWNQGCQMVCFHTKNPNLGKFGGSCNGRFGYILWPFGPFSDHIVYFWQYGKLCGHLVYFARFSTFIVPRKIWQPCLECQNNFIPKMGTSGNLQCDFIIFYCNLFLQKYWLSRIQILRCLSKIKILLPFRNFHFFC